MKRNALLAVAAGVCGTLLQAADLSAQKALVYCPVGIDETGCSNTVAALGGAFPDGVDRGYDGSGGTVSLAGADLWQYAVVVVPSLADDAEKQPYALLRQPAVAERMRDAVLGRLAVWSGTPDQGSAGREHKDALLRGLAAWAAGNHAVVRGPGLVALADVSVSAMERYGWLRAVTGRNVIADARLQSYASVRALSATGTAIVGSLAYPNMATYGLQLPEGASGVSLDAVGQTGTSVGGQVVLMTAPGGNTGGAVVRTDRDDYPPGDTVTITGSGFQPGEAVVLTLHEDPQLHANRTFTTAADALGNFVFTGFAPEEHDLDVRFILTAAGQSSGLQAQTTFTDGRLVTIRFAFDPGSRVVVAQGESAVYTVDVTMGGNPSPCEVILEVVDAEWELPTGAVASFDENPVVVNPGNVSFSRTLTITTTFSGPPEGHTPPGEYRFTIRARRGAGCSASPSPIARGTLLVTYEPPPLLGLPDSATIPELVEFTATVMDGGGRSGLTFWLYRAPEGASIDSLTGVFTWTPTEAQGDGSTYEFTVWASDIGKTVLLTVPETNQAPVLAPIPDRTLREGESLAGATLSFTDDDLPAQLVSVNFISAPPGAYYEGESKRAGAVFWTAGEGDGGQTRTFVVEVQDADGAADTASFDVRVLEANAAPVVAGVPASAAVDELAPYAFTASATDADLPAQPLTFSLSGAPAGAAIDPATGAFSWTPTEAQGPGSYTFRVLASDGSATGESQITVTVAEVNAAPVLAAIGGRSVDEETALGFGATATDPDLPADGLTYSLVGAPAGASIDPATGAFAWTPGEAQGPGSYTFRVRVADDGSPALADEEEVTVTVAEVNRAPALAEIPDRIVDEGGTVGFTAGGSDPALPASALAYSLVGSVPAGAGIDPATGAFTWTPADDDPTATPGDAHAFTVRVSDGALSAERTFTVTVNNVAPTLTGASADPLTPVPVGGAVRVAAAFTDPGGSADSYRLRVTWDTGTPPVDYPGYTSGTPVSRTDLPAGVYTITLQVLDDDGGVSAARTVTQYVVVYDPSGGFVTGGGWIDSPAGACRLAACTAATAGRAGFGFVSRYQRGQARPSGSTEFHFQAGDLSFRSTLYDWLVAAGSRAQYKGEGTIGGGPTVYGFLLTAIDGQASGGGGTDRFRIKIWDKATGSVVYDNQAGQAEDSDAATALGGGGIVIHGG